ncbi:MAG: flagellar biosynthetic protein FliO [Rhodospirillales bacterium]
MAWGDYAQAVLALIFVLGLVGVLILVLRHFGFGAPTPTVGNRQKRVRIAEVTALDARRRLVLVRHDDREHLILLGTTSETIVESRDGPPLEQPGASAPSANSGFARALGRALGATPKAGNDSSRKTEDSTS